MAASRTLKIPLEPFWLQHLLDEIGECVFVKDLQGRYVYANRATLDLWGVKDMKDVVGKTDAHFFNLEVAGELIKNDRNVMENKTILRAEEVNFIRHTNEYRTYQSIKKPLYDEQQNVIGLFGLSSDITYLKHLEEELRHQKDQQTAILDNMDAIVYVKDGERRFVYANQHICAALGKPLDKIIGRTDAQISGQEISDVFAKSDNLVLTERKRVALEELFPGPDGQMLHYWSIKMPILFDGQPALIGFSSDITELHNLQEELKNLANTDMLTGAANRRFFYKAAEKAFDRSLISGSPLSVITFDIDWFKKINDTWGHPVGDEALKAVSKSCLHGLRKDNLFARVGGEEFAVLLPGAALAVAEAIAERLRQAIASIQLNGEASACGVSASFGVAQLKKEDASFDKLFSRADQALYRAKNEGRNRVKTAD